MATPLTIPRRSRGGPATDQQELYLKGLDYVQKLARHVWTDYNLHDPGVTTLELLCYALTDLSYRASYPMEDLLASSSDNVANMKAQFFTARQILPNRALTVLDYRKLLIDLKGVKNAWLRPADVRYYADTLKATLLFEDPGSPGTREVQLKGLYNVLVDYMDDVTSPANQSEVLAAVRTRLHENRNLCEDFIGFQAIETQSFILCSEIELEPDADAAEVKARILYEVQQYLAPAVRNYTLLEMLERRSAEEVFDGPALDCGFIDDDELTAADLREEIRLSDVISIIMDIRGVRAVRDIVINPALQVDPLENKWLVPIQTGKKAVLNNTLSRLVFYKRAMPIVPSSAAVDSFLAQLVTEARAKLETAVPYDLDIPLGKHRSPGAYFSFQNHFPAIYGIGEVGLSGTATQQRRALAYQLKAYLLFFDQVFANYMAQLAHVRELFSNDDTLQQTYFYQVVDSFQDFEKIYSIVPGAVAETLKNQVEAPDAQIERRNRFLDHLIARFAEQFNEYVAIMHSAFSTSGATDIQAKARFLKDYPAISSGRAIGYNYTLQTVADRWNTENISGLERRLAKLLGLENVSRRDLSTAGPENFQEGMYLIENILLRPDTKDDPMLRICVDPNCTDCQDDDPYSYRVHFILPAYAGRFQNMDFRRFVEEVIREETPAHILPKVCWIGVEDMTKLEKAYHDWIDLKADASSVDRLGKLTAFTNTLFDVKNVYPTQKLFECDAPEDKAKFILGRTALGTIENDDEE